MSSLSALIKKGVTPATVDSVEEAVAKLRDAYYNGEPLVIDRVFDSLIDGVRKLKPESKVLKTVGAPVPTATKLKKFPHKIPMTSLSNAIGTAEFVGWFNRTMKNTKKLISLVVEPKYDGASVELIYDKGVLERAITRGDGREGEDVTANLKKMNGVPESIRVTRCMCIRGEVMLRKSKAKHFPDAEALRNVANGTMKRLDGRGAEHLDFVAYDAMLGNKTRYDDEIEMLADLASMGFQVTEHEHTFALSKVVEIQAALGNRRETDDFGYDGAVVKVRHRAHKELFKSDPYEDPKWAVAFKWEEERFQTVIKGIELSVGRTGAITPIALVKPTKIGGTTVQRASLCNWSEVKRLNIGIGDEVEIVKAGEIIPKIVTVTKNMGGGRLKRPATCPSCSGDTSKDGPRQMCLNPSCPAQVSERLLNWASKRNILSVGPGVIDKFIEGDVSTIPGLYGLKESAIIKLLGSTAIGTKVAAALHTSRKVTIYDLIGSLGIDGIGRTEAEYLFDCKVVSKAADILKLTINRLLKLDGYQETKAAKVVSGLYKAHKLIAELEDTLDVYIENVVNKTSELEGISFCFTGVRPSDEEEQVINSKGGEIKSGVSKNLTYLVAKDPSASSSKLDSARGLGVKVIGLADFRGVIKA